MNYTTPKKVLTYLASHGPSAVQLESLRLLGLPACPDRWPEIQQGSRDALLRRLACNSKKSASARLQALKELLRFDEVKPQPAKLDADIVALLTAGPAPASTKPDTTEMRGSNPVPESPPPKPQEPLSVPVQKKAEVQEADEPEPSPGPVWFREDSAEGDKLSAHLAAKRYRETFGVWDWAVLGQRLAAERERKPKQRLYGMPSCGSELND